MTNKPEERFIVTYEMSYIPFKNWHVVDTKEYKFEWWAKFNIWKWIWLDTLLTTGILHRATLNNKLITVGSYDK